ncbi:MAG: hypothetical protein ABI746_13245 [Dermatophilaceae bacterium]
MATAQTLSTLPSDAHLTRYVLGALTVAGSARDLYRHGASRTYPQARLRHDGNGHDFLTSKLCIMTYHPVDRSWVKSRLTFGKAPPRRIARAESFEINQSCGFTR